MDNDTWREPGVRNWFARTFLNPVDRHMWGLTMPLFCLTLLTTYLFRVVF